MRTVVTRNYVFKQAKAKVMSTTKGLYPAPLKILDVIKTGLEKGETAGYKAEAEVYKYNCNFYQISE